MRWIFLTHKLNRATGLFDRRNWFKALPDSTRLWLITHQHWAVVLMVVGAGLFGFGLAWELAQQGLLK